MEFSTALNLVTTVALVGGVAFGAWQLWLAARTRTTQISMHLMEMLYSPELVEGLTALIDVPAGLSRGELQARLGERWNNVFMAMSTFDGLGLLVYRGEVSFGAVDDFFHHSVSIVWTRTRGAVQDMRALQDESAFDWLQWLAEQQQTRRQRRRRPSQLAH
jgi:hypothetical protein